MSRLVLDTNCLIQIVSLRSKYHPYGIVLFVVKIFFVSLISLLLVNEIIGDVAVAHKIQAVALI